MRRQWATAVGSDRNNDTNVNDRPPGVGRNTGVGFDFATLDLRLARRFALGATRVEAMVEAFNLLNRSNPQLHQQHLRHRERAPPGLRRPHRRRRLAAGAVRLAGEPLRTRAPSGWTCWTQTRGEAAAEWRCAPL
jgi:hypothetical protein